MWFDPNQQDTEARRIGQRGEAGGAILKEIERA
jgi:hypothetical protein